MPDYILDTEYNDITNGEQEVNLKEFECCTFTRCDFSLFNFIGVIFIDCNFNDCLFSGAKINHVALRSVLFNRCKMVDVNFSMCDKL
ncbi:MAG TPA: pentapeptide repeat-containing protein, partial [Flavobacterium sp.]|nr:pentapeptide repeat-containing protein [Flavobacterium sp.]